MNWNGVSVMVSGGASFIGSHLVEELPEQGAKVVIGADFISGRFENLKACRQRVKIHKAKLARVW